MLPLVALLIDRWVGEPPNALHPVVWMGKLTGVLIGLPERLASPLVPGRFVQLLWGACVTLVVAGTFSAVTFVLLTEIAPWPVSSFLVSAILLKTTLSLDGLRKAAETMQSALTTDREAARYALRNLCSRDPSSLDETQLATATVESLAENASDSLVAPLFYFALLGVPGAMAYRAVNTLDAMIGYRGRYEYLGKAAARLDDLLNLIPARLTALLLLLAGLARGHQARSGYAVLARDHSKPESPNAGWPMAAMAGLLGVQLDKPGHYVLGDAVNHVSVTTIDTAWRIVRDACWTAAVLAVLALGVRHVCFG